MDALREPRLREERAMTAEALAAFLNSNKLNAESAIMTVVGDRMEIDTECVHCQELNGPWMWCTAVRGDAGIGLACNNCHKLGDEEKCEKYLVPDNAGAQHWRRIIQRGVRCINPLVILG
ncbi:hypothetical protein N7499_011116 [Penicillium canescens]|nr:hypothetical protein N7499_011116 [Penicillium canescens]KAJ6182721.1 hypothetical protein N7485_001363 [Penicillium canescens]